MVGQAYPRSNEDSIVPPESLPFEHAAVDAEGQKDGGDEPQHPDASKKLYGLAVVRKGGQLRGRQRHGGRVLFRIRVVGG